MKMHTDRVWMNQIQSQKLKISRLCVELEHRTQTAVAWPFLSAVHVGLLIYQTNRNCGNCKMNQILFIYTMQCCGSERNKGGGKEREITKGWDCIVKLWRIKGACVYLSCPIDHHLKQEEWGKERPVQLGLFDTLLSCSRMHSSSEVAVQSDSILARDVAGVGHLSLMQFPSAADIKFIQRWRLSQSLRSCKAKTNDRFHYRWICPEFFRLIN